MTSILRVDSIQTAAGGSATASGLGIGGIGKVSQQVVGTTSTAITDNSNLPSNANLIEVKPIHNPTKVIIFGKITLEFLFETNLMFFFGFSIYLLAINVSPATALWLTFTNGS